MPMPSLPSAEQLRFSSAALPAADRFERYRALYAGGTDATQTGPDFSADVTGWRLDRAVLFDRRLHHVGHERTPARVAADGFDHFTLTLAVEGGVEIGDGREMRPLPPGELVLLDMRQPMQNRLDNARIITVSLAREKVTAAVDDAEQLHGLILTAREGGLLADYLLALARRLGDLPAGAIAAATQPIAMLLAVAIAADGDAQQLPGHADRIRRLIEARLVDPDFTAADVVAASDLSRATLYRLFQPFGGLAHYIRRRRLNRVRAALDDPADARSFAVIAHAAGFASEAHASRLFQEAYGRRPGEFRAAAVPGAAPSPERMADLVGEVR